MNAWKVESNVKFHVNARILQLQNARVTHDVLLVFFLFHGSEAMVWREKERSRIRSVQNDNLRGSLGITIMD